MPREGGRRRVECHGVEGDGEGHGAHQRALRGEEEVDGGRGVGQEGEALRELPGDGLHGGDGGIEVPGSGRLGLRQLDRT